ncbi:unnamed protein product, partial [Gulo gulo]
EQGSGIRAQGLRGSRGRGQAYSCGGQRSLPGRGGTRHGSKTGDRPRPGPRQARHVKSSGWERSRAGEHEGAGRTPPPGGRAAGAGDRSLSAAPWRRVSEAEAGPTRGRLKPGRSEPW